MATRDIRNRDAKTGAGPGGTQVFFCVLGCYGASLVGSFEGLVSPESSELPNSATIIAESGAQGSGFPCGDALSLCVVR